MNKHALRTLIRQHDNEMRRRQQTNKPDEAQLLTPTNQATENVTRIHAPAFLDYDKIREYLHEIYPAPHIYALRITRLEEKILGSFALDAELSLYLGTENLGVFAGGCGATPSIICFLRALCQLNDGCSWVVIPSSHELNKTLYQELNQSPISGELARQLPAYWSVGKVIFSTPEGLVCIPSERFGQPPLVAGILLFDSSCWVHRARGYSGEGKFEGNDRPQYIVDFRSRFAYGQWSPPLFVFTQKPAKSISTMALHSPYCLEGFMFILGSSILCE